MTQVGQVATVVTMAQALGEYLGTGQFSDNSFRFQAFKGHFTYKGHVDFDLLTNKIIEVGGGTMEGVRRVSMVHELGADSEPDLGDEDFRRYEHTHLAVEWKKKIDRRDCRFMDIDINPVGALGTPTMIHPNIQVKKSLLWFQGLFYDYHQGKKRKKGGGYTVTPPVKLMQFGIAGWDKEREVMEDTVRAPTLIDACLIAGVAPRSVGDVVHLRSAVKKRGCEKALGSCDRPWRELPDDWDRAEKSLVIVGPTNAGKTNFAKAQFEHGYVIRQLEDLKNVPDYATGLVFDDQEYAKLNLQEQKMIFDCREETTIKMRYFNAQKPKLPAIFTCNDLHRLCDLHGDTGAIATRTYVWEIPADEKMYE